MFDGNLCKLITMLLVGSNGFNNSHKSVAIFLMALCDIVSGVDCEPN